jgi:hypothetical protein
VKPTPLRNRILSRRAIGELGALEASVQELGTHRSAALRLVLASRNATTQLAQREFWLEFSWIDQEYRAAVRRLAEFCLQHRDGSRRTPQSE